MKSVGVKILGSMASLAALAALSGCVETTAVPTRTVYVEAGRTVYVEGGRTVIVEPIQPSYRRY